MGGDGLGLSDRPREPSAPRSGTNTFQADQHGADKSTLMRTLLEFLGIVTPRAARREPVALPAWIRRVTPVLVIGLTLASMVVFVVVRALVS